MTLKELRIFTLVAELGSVTRVATSLGIAQSAVSRQIADLEAQVGQRLFHRTGRGLTVTEFAHGLLPRAATLLADMKQFSDDAKAGVDAGGGTVNIGFVPGVTAPLSSLLFNRLRQTFPGIQLSIFEGYSGEIETWLATSKIDIGVLNSYCTDSPIRFQPLFSSEVYLIGPAGSTYITAPTIEFKKLAGIPLVHTVTPNSLTVLSHKIARQNGLTLKIEALADSARAIHDLIANSGLHCTFPYHAVAGQLASGEFKASRIVEPSITQKVVLATSTHHPLSEAARRVVKILLALKRELPVDPMLAASAGCWPRAPENEIPSSRASGYRTIRALRRRSW